MQIKKTFADIKRKIADRFKKNTCSCEECHCDDTKYDDMYDYETGLEFIWGVKSVSDYDHEYACVGSRNDIEITYDNNSETYYLDILTDRAFDRDKKDEVKFLKRMLDEFTDYMKSNDYDINRKLPFAFNHISIAMDFSSDSIEELYTKFRIFVAGFTAVYG